MWACRERGVRAARSPTLSGYPSVWMRGLLADWYRAAALALADPLCLLARDMQQQEHGVTKVLGCQVPGGRTRRQGSFKHIRRTEKRVYNGCQLWTSNMQKGRLGHKWRCEGANLQAAQNQDEQT